MTKLLEFLVFNDASPRWSKQCSEIFWIFENFFLLYGHVGWIIEVVENEVKYMFHSRIFMASDGIKVLQVNIKELLLLGHYVFYSFQMTTLTIVVNEYIQWIRILNTLQWLLIHITIRYGLQLPTEQLMSVFFIVRVQNSISMLQIQLYLLFDLTLYAIFLLSFMQHWYIVLLQFNQIDFR